MYVDSLYAYCPNNLFTAYIFLASSGESTCFFLIFSVDIPREVFQRHKNFCLPSVTPSFTLSPPTPFCSSFGLFLCGIVKMVLRGGCANPQAADNQLLPFRFHLHVNRSPPGAQEVFVRVFEVGELTSGRWS